jgi:hypothetical protein
MGFHHELVKQVLGRLLSQKKDMLILTDYMFVGRMVTLTLSPIKK